MIINQLKVKLKADIRPVINFFRKKKLIKRKYSSHKHDKKTGSHITIFVVDGELNHGGLSDRFNGIISTYAICKAQNIPFRIKWHYPFQLEDYIIPNQYDWILKSNETYILNRTSKIVITLNDPKAKILFHLSKNKQNHVYTNMNLLARIEQKLERHYEWYQLFQELFKPNKKLEQLLAEHTKRIGESYIGIVFRFQQLLGDFNEGTYPTLPIEKRQLLIRKCINTVKQIKERYKEYNILVTSDSISFLNIVKQEDKVFIIPGKVVHITFSQNEDYDVYMKSFVDFFMLSKAQKVFSIITSEMIIDGHLFITSFPEYAAKAGNTQFERIYIK